MKHGCQLYDNCTKLLSKRVENVQRRAALCITRAYRASDHKKLLKEVGLDPLERRRKKQKLLFIFKCLNNLAPDYLAKLVHDQLKSQMYNTRGHIKIHPISSKKWYLHNSFIVSSIHEWKTTSMSLDTVRSLDSFKRLIDDNSEYGLNPLNLYGNNSGHINLSRIRMGLSGIK